MLRLIWRLSTSPNSWTLAIVLIFKYFFQILEWVVLVVPFHCLSSRFLVWTNDQRSGRNCGLRSNGWEQLPNPNSNSNPFYFIFFMFFPLFMFFGLDICQLLGNEKTVFEGLLKVLTVGKWQIIYLYNCNKRYRLVFTTVIKSWNVTVKPILKWSIAFCCKNMS